MITHSDEDPDFAPDDPLAVILRPPTEFLGPPPGRYTAIRRRAARRKLLRAALGTAVACGVAALVVLPLRQPGTGGPDRPATPLAPPLTSVSPAPRTPPAPAPSATAPVASPVPDTPTADPTTARDQARPSAATDDPPVTDPSPSRARDTTATSTTAPR
ncbi:hypothetical protein [Streptomyces flavalbus]|uniref:Uncharacterized protein n=1 Tax=Streptomyces flavalbus TaxID=2665155 RepID=A0ABW2WI32_9ACTN